MEYSTISPIVFINLIHVPLLIVYLYFCLTTLFGGTNGPG